MSGAEEPLELEPGLERALAAWRIRGDTSSLRRWLERVLDAEGVPRQLPVTRWWPVLAQCAHAGLEREGAWPAEIDSRLEGFLRTALRFSRPDGSAVFNNGEFPSDCDLPWLLRYWADRLNDRGLLTVADWWFRRGRKRIQQRGRGREPGPAPPPLPAWSQAGRPLAVLRADWSKRGDIVAIDQRAGGSASRFELFGSGTWWLGPSWTVPDEIASPAKTTVWRSDSQADVAEWTFRVGDSRVTRLVLLLRGRRLALLADQVAGPAASAAMRIELAPGVRAQSAAQRRMLVLRHRPGLAGSARVLPIGLPAHAYPTERGALTVSTDGRTIDLKHDKPQRRCWLPLLVSWDLARNRREPRWRVLTVTEAGTICAPQTAFAARVAWSQTESLVIYRSLGRAASRAFLGHKTEARFLVGLFDREGTLTPLVTIDE